MCAPLLAVAGMGMSLMGGMVQAKGARDEADAKAEAYERQAAVNRANSEMQARQAVITQTTSQYEQRRKGEQQDELGARQRNAFAAQGLTIEGSPTDVMLSSAQEGALDLAAIQWNEKLKAQNLNFNAGMEMINADNNMKAARSAEKAGKTAAMSAMIGGFSGALGAFKGVGGGTSLGMKY